MVYLKMIRIMLGKARNIFLNLLLLTISLLGSLLFLEYSFRFYLRSRYDRQIAKYQHSLFKIERNSLLEMSMIPNLQKVNKIEGNPEGTWSYTINNDGYRGKNIAREKADGVKRIMFLGDSYTFGWGIDDDETYPEQLKLILRNNNDFNVEVINLGIPGYNTIQESELLRENIHLFNPDVVVLAYVMNDAEHQMNVPLSPGVKYKLAYSWVCEFFKDFLNTKFPNICHFAVNIQKNEPYLIGFKHNNPKWKESKKALKSMVSLCNKRHIAFVVVILPDFTQRFDESYRYKYIHHSVTEWCKEFNVDSIDLLPNFLGTDHKKLWVIGEGHPNEIAHQMIAEILSGYLKGILDKRM